MTTGVPDPVGDALDAMLRLGMVAPRLQAFSDGGWALRDFPVTSILVGGKPGEAVPAHFVVTVDAERFRLLPQDYREFLRRARRDNLLPPVAWRDKI